MPAYVIAQVDVHDAEMFETYRPIAARTIAQYGGRYLVRGGAVTSVEGDWAPPRLVVLEFPDMAAAKTWYESEEYAPGIDLRQKSTRSQVVFVEGLPSS